jgi:ribosomal protein S27AE
MIQQIQDVSSPLLSDRLSGSGNRLRTFECPRCGRKSVHLIIETHPMRIRCGGRGCGLVLAELPARPRQL